MAENSLKQPRARSKKRKAPEERKREPTAGGFKPGDPRINRKGRPRDLPEFRQIMRELGEDKALDYLLECMQLGVDPRAGKKRRPSNLGLQAATEWLHLCRGKPRQQVAVTGMDDGPVRVAGGPDLSKLSVAELKAWRELVRKAQPDAETAVQ
jgi:hypothetical protein